MHELIFPKQNRKDFDELPDFIRQGITAHFVDHYSEVFDLVLGSGSSPSTETVTVTVAPIVPSPAAAAAALANPNINAVPVPPVDASISGAVLPTPASQGSVNVTN